MSRSTYRGTKESAGRRGLLVLAGFVVLCGVVLALARGDGGRGREVEELPEGVTATLWQVLHAVEQAEDSLAANNYGETRVRLQRARAALTNLLSRSPDGTTDSRQGAVPQPGADRAPRPMGQVSLPAASRAQAGLPIDQTKEARNGRPEEGKL